MKHILFNVILISLLLDSQGFAMQEVNIEQPDKEIKSFNPKQRSVELQKEINASFLNIQKGNDLKIWSYAGTQNYYNYLDQLQLIKTLIQNHKKTDQPLYFMDIGAGDFSWGFTIAKLINDNDLLNPSQKVHIISLTGENLSVPEKVVNKNCTLYNFTSFCLENLQDELKKKFPGEDISFQLIVTRWALTHLVDPLGTFYQAYSLLTPHTGIMMMDSFRFATPKTKSLSLKDVDIQTLYPLLSVLRDLDIPFVNVLRYDQTSECCGVPFILKSTGILSKFNILRYSNPDLTEKPKIFNDFSRVAIFDYQVTIPQKFKHPLGIKNYIQGYRGNYLKILFSDRHFFNQIQSWKIVNPVVDTVTSHI